ncbi:hypothetical protein [Streptomyces sp. CAS3]
MAKPHTVSCVEHGAQPHRRLGGAEATVIIVIITLAAALVAIAGMPLAIALQALVGAGLISVVVVSLVTGASVRWLRPLAKLLLASAA